MDISEQRNEYRNVIFDRTKDFKNLDGFKVIAKLSGGYVNDSYDKIYSKIENSSCEYKNFVIDRFNNLDYENFSNMMIVCNNTMKIIEENCSKESIQEYFDWVLKKVTDFTLALHLTKKSSDFKRLLNEKIEKGELDNALMRILNGNLDPEKVNRLLSILNFDNKITDILKKTERVEECISYYISILAKKYDFKNITKLIKNHKNLLNILSKSRIRNAIENGFRIHQSYATEEEIRDYNTLLNWIDVYYSE